MGHNAGTHAASPLTIAYVSIGAYTVIAGLPGGHLPSHVCDLFGGQYSFIEEAIAEAGVLDELWPKYREGFSGVFAYAIAEEFGKWAARKLLEGAGYIDAAAARAQAERLYEMA